MTARPTPAEVEAAARELHHWGEVHGWWPESVRAYDALDPIGKDEFDAIVERVLMAASSARDWQAAGQPGRPLPSS